MFDQINSREVPSSQPFNGFVKVCEALVAHHSTKLAVQIVNILLSSINIQYLTAQMKANSLHPSPREAGN